MNKLEITPLDISPRSENHVSHYETSDRESHYSSVPSERVQGETATIQSSSYLHQSNRSYQSPSKVMDPTDGENIESTVRTSHSSPVKVQRPQFSNLDDKLKLHDYVVDERQNLAECFQTYQIHDFMLSPERSHLKASARNMGQSYRSPLLSPGSFSFRNRAAVQLRDLTKRRGFDNAYDIMDPQEVHAMEEAVNFVSPIQNQVLRKGKLVEFI